MENERFEKIEGAIADIGKVLGELAGSVKGLTSGRQAELDADQEIEKLRQDKIRSAERQVQEERGRIRAIESMCEKLSASTGIDFDDLRSQLIQDGTPEKEAYQRCLDRIAAGPKGMQTGLRISISKEDKEKTRDAAVDGLMIRSGVAVDKVQDRETEYQTMSMLELAKNRMMVFGQSARGLDPMGIFQRALSTSDFSHILADVANKAMLDGFENATETYDVWADTTGRVNDFKAHVFARASEAPTLVEVNPDGGEYTYGHVTDARETVTVVDYGIIVPFTRKAMVNDDLGALADIREKLGAAARRKYGDLVYAILTGNPTMGDSVLLWDASTHKNYLASGFAPSIVRLNAAAAAMATQKDLKGIQNLNIIPQFLIAPWALKGTVDNLLAITSPVEVKAAIATAASMNPWSYLQPIYDARMDASSTTRWILAARKGMTVKLFTLNGNMIPLLETKEGWSVDGMEFKCRITAAAKAMDWRGMYRDDGTGG